jgi:hypothetical protein
VKVHRVLALAAPNNVVRGLPLQKIWELWGLFAIVEELVEWHFQSTSKLFQCLDGRNRVPIFNAGCLLAMSAWNDEEAAGLAESYGAIKLLEKGRLASTLFPAIEECMGQKGMSQPA